MNPSVGRIVHFHPSEYDSLHKNNGAEFHAAIITQVWSPGLADSAVNLVVFPAYGPPEVRSSVAATTTHNTHPDAIGSVSRWAWPPREV